jgi:hypothetical protein
MEEEGLPLVFYNSAIKQQDGQYIAPFVVDLGLNNTAQENATGDASNINKPSLA